MRIIESYDTGFSIIDFIELLPNEKVSELSQLPNVVFNIKDRFGTISNLFLTVKEPTASYTDDEFNIVSFREQIQTILDSILKHEYYDSPMVLVQNPNEYVDPVNTIVMLSMGNRVYESPNFIYKEIVTNGVFSGVQVEYLLDQDIRLVVMSLGIEKAKRIGVRGHLVVDDETYTFVFQHTRINDLHLYVEPEDLLLSLHTKPNSPNLRLIEKIKNAEFVFDEIQGTEALESVGNDNSGVQNSPFF